MSRKEFPIEEYELRWTRAQAKMAEQGLDALFMTERTNFRYFTGSQTRQFNNKQRPMVVILPAKGKPTLMIYSLEEAKARAETWVDDIRGYTDAPFPVSLAVDTLKDLGLDKGRIGCELGANQRVWMTMEEFDGVRNAFPEAEFLDAAQLLVEVRLAKTEREIAKIRKACEITELAWQLIQTRVHPGLTIPQAERICYQSLVDAGSDPLTPGFVLLDVVGKGDDYVYRPGDLFFCDLGGSYNGYKADFTRMATFGPASDFFRESHAQIMQVFNAVVGAMRPGVRACDIAEVCTRELVRLGYPPLKGNKRIGHGLGLEHQEAPSLNLVDTTVLVPGMLLTPEPRFVRDGHFIMVEEDVVVTDAGAVKLSDGCSRLYEING
jgi:Xaa-Pro aminopeptidase